ncbi:MAG: type II and III secretion system protein [Candidatus Hydrogenedentes bacterium]|nr:type II and III secretion system protein [Candidatus Hydrogenedentota bacterium]
MVLRGFLTTCPYLPGIWRWAVCAGVAILLAAQGLGTPLAEDVPRAEELSADRIPRQVLVEVLILEIETDRASEIGTDLVYARGSRGREAGSAVHEASLRTLRFDVDNLVTFPTADTGPSAGATIRPDSTVLGIPHPLVGMTLEGDIIIGDSGTIFARMRALIDEGDARLISRPIVAVQTGKTAEIHVGGEIPYQSLRFDDEGRPIMSVAFEKVGVDMVVTPEILPGDVVKLTLDPVEFSSLSRTENIRGVDLPFFRSRSQSTTVRVPDTQTCIIGGLHSRETRRTVRRIPILGRIPVLGFFFRSTETSSVITDLKILITPTIFEKGKDVPLPPEFIRARRGRMILEEEL